MFNVNPCRNMNEKTEERFDHYTNTLNIHYFHGFPDCRKAVRFAYYSNNINVIIIFPRSTINNHPNPSRHCTRIRVRRIRKENVLSHK